MPIMKRNVIVPTIARHLERETDAKHLLRKEVDLEMIIVGRPKEIENLAGTLVVLTKMSPDIVMTKEVPAMEKENHHETKTAVHLVAMNGLRQQLYKKQDPAVVREVKTMIEVVNPRESENDDRDPLDLPLEVPAAKITEDRIRRVGKHILPPKMMLLKKNHRENLVRLLRLWYFSDMALSGIIPTVMLMMMTQVFILHFVLSMPPLLEDK